MKVKAITSYAPDNLGYIDPYTKAQGWGEQPNQGLYYEGKILVNGAEPYNRKFSTTGATWSVFGTSTYGAYSPGNCVGGLWPLESDNATWDNLTKNTYQLENARKTWKTKTIPDTDTNDVFVLMFNQGYNGGSEPTLFNFYFDGNEEPTTLEDAVNLGLIYPLVLISGGYSTASDFWGNKSAINTTGNKGPVPTIISALYQYNCTEIQSNADYTPTGGRPGQIVITFKLKPGHRISKLMHWQFEHIAVNLRSALYTLSSSDYNITLKDNHWKINNGQFDYNLNIKETNNG